MTWKDFQTEKERYKTAWKKMKASYAGDIRRFLESSSLVVSAGREFDIDADIEGAFKSCPAFFEGKPEVCDGEIDLSKLTVGKSWAVRVKFPYLDIDFIQELKKSPFCDKRRTLLKSSLAAVFLVSHG